MKKHIGLFPIIGAVSWLMCIGIGLFLQHILPYQNISDIFRNAGFFIAGVVIGGIIFIILLINDPILKEKKNNK